MAFLDVRNLCKSFGDTKVLKGIDFTMEKGEVVAILGSSGGGKTTFLRCLNYLEIPDAGTVTVGDKNYFDADEYKMLTDKEIRTKRLLFGLVFQQFNLFPQYTALKNVYLPLYLRAKERINKSVPFGRGRFAEYKKSLAECKARAEELLCEVGLSDKINNYPCELSGGQQQRVAIARALAQEPAILCFDEPTSALDPELTGEVLRVIKELKEKDRTMIIVTHEMEFARNVADRIIFMADGVIEEEGAPEEIFTNPKSQKTRAFLQHSVNKL